VKLKEWRDEILVRIDGCGDQSGIQVRVFRGCIEDTLNIGIESLFARASVQARRPPR
jgi:hypothetical protein